MEWDADTLENCYYAGAALVVTYLTWNGWRQGVVRQAMTLTAIASAYAAGYFGAGLAAPLFTFLRYPEPITRLIAGTTLGLMTFIIISTIGHLVFKKTAQHASQTVRRGYGISGAALGLLFGGVLFFFASNVVRILGVIARSDVEAVAGQQRAAASHPGTTMPAAQVSPLVSGLAKLGTALSDGGSGAMLKKYDPIPSHVVATLTKLSRMVSNPDAVDRFLSYQGIDELSNHPKLLALRNDPQVSELLANHSYFRLLRHDKVVALASDPDFSARIKQMNFDEALDYALQPAPHNTPPARQTP